MNNIARDIYKELGNKMPKKIYKKYCFCKCKGPNFGSCNKCGYDNNDMIFCPAFIISITCLLFIIGLAISITSDNFSYLIKIFIMPSVIFIVGHFIIGFLRYKIRNIKKFNDCYSDYISHEN